MIDPNGLTAEAVTPHFEYNHHEAKRTGVAMEARSGLEKRTNFYPYPQKKNSDGAPTVWTLDYLGPCSKVCS